MFCAIDELIKLSLSQWLGVRLKAYVVEPIQLLWLPYSATCLGKLSTTAAKFLAYVYLEVSLSDYVERYSHLPVCSILKEHVTSIYA